MQARCQVESTMQLAYCGIYCFQISKFLMSNVFLPMTRTCTLLQHPASGTTAPDVTRAGHDGIDARLCPR